MTHITRCSLLLNTYSDYNGNVDHISEQFLQFLIYEPLSTYKIKSTYMKYNNQNIDYKGVHKRVKKLLIRKLIQKADDVDVSEDKRAVHGAIFYKLSHMGVYHIIFRIILLGTYETPASQFRKLLVNYKDDPFFHTILYPYFNVETVLNMDPSIQFYAILKYLRACCEAIEDNVRTRKIGQGGGTPLFRWNDISPGQKHLFKYVENKFILLKEHLLQEYHLDWLKESYVSKFEDDNTLKFSHRSNSVIVKLNEDKSKATLAINRQIAQELNVSLLHAKGNRTSVHTIYLPKMSNEEFAAMFLRGILKNRVSELVFAVTSAPFTENSKVLLAKDNKFINLVKRTRNEFNKRCEEILVD
jgi:hypothetical protein